VVRSCPGLRRDGCRQRPLGGSLRDGRHRRRDDRLGHDPGGRLVEIHPPMVPLRTPSGKPSKMPRYRSLDAEY